MQDDERAENKSMVLDRTLKHLNIKKYGPPGGTQNLFIRSHFDSNNQILALDKNMSDEEDAGLLGRFLRRESSREVEPAPAVVVGVAVVEKKEKKQRSVKQLVQIANARVKRQQKSERGLKRKRSN